MAPRIQAVFFASALLFIAAMTMHLMTEKSADPSLCLIGEGCIRSAQSQWGQILGVKTSLLGILWTITIAISAFYVPRLGARWAAVRILSLAGACCALLLQYYSWKMIKAPCGWCSVGAACSVLLCAMLCIPSTSAALEKQAGRLDLRRIGSVTLVGLAILPYVGVSLLASPTKCIEIDESIDKFLTNRAGNWRASEIAIVFTDFACPACFKRTPRLIEEARTRGLKPILVPITLKAQAGSDMTAFYYYASLTRGYDRAFVERFPGPEAIGTYNELAKQELRPSEDELLRARTLVINNNKFYVKHRISGTPHVALVRQGKLCIAPSFDDLD